VAAKPFFIFDLDDTLYPERQYSLSALEYIGNSIEKTYRLENAAEHLITDFKSGAGNAIGSYWERHQLPQSELQMHLAAMQAHSPVIKLYEDTKIFLQLLEKKDLRFAIVTDGRSSTQRQKITKLGLTNAIAICISEETGAAKPDPIAFEPVMQHAAGKQVVFVGDNPKKDFYFANKKRWVTIMRRDDGSHIRAQTLPDDVAYHPQQTIDSFSELEKFL